MRAPGTCEASRLHWDWLSRKIPFLPRHNWRPTQYRLKPSIENTGKLDDARRSVSEPRAWVRCKPNHEVIELDMRARTLPD